MKEIFHLSYTNLKHSQKRSWLTMIGIFIGIAAVVSLISLGQGLEEAIDERFSKIGSDKLFLLPQSPFGPGATSEVKDPITSKDIKEVESVQGVKEVAAMAYRSAKVEVGEDVGFYFVAGIDTSDPAKYDLTRVATTVDLVEGRELRSGEVATVLAGADYVREEAFLEPKGVGDRIKVEGQKFTIVGILEPLGNSIDDRTVYMELSKAEEVLGISDEYDWITVQVLPGQVPSEVAERIERKLLDFRDLDEDTKDFDISTPEDLLESFNTILLIVRVVLTGIALISLLVGGIGIMNTMYTAVLERTKEIGIMKAIGASPKIIQSIFLFESGLLGLAGGAIGVAIGLGLSISVELIGKAALRTELLHAYISAELIVGALLFSTLVGMISGFLPARAASKQNAVDSLRYE